MDIPSPAETKPTIVIASPTSWVITGVTPAFASTDSISSYNAVPTSREKNTIGSSAK
ncbi:hypothetical protein D3C73_1622590 [compost metagenome]